jgi:hypothetical protein
LIKPERKRGLEISGSYNMHRGHDAHKILVRKSERKRPLEIYRSDWEDNIKTDLKK